MSELQPRAEAKKKLKEMQRPLKVHLPVIMPIALVCLLLILTAWAWVRVEV
jgi:hypothetical protein